MEDGLPCLPTAARYCFKLCKILMEDGVSPRTVLQGTSLKMTTLQEPERFVSHQQLERILANIEQAGCEQLPGLRLGAALNFSAHGSVGYASVTAPTVYDGIKIACQYGELNTGLVSLIPSTTQKTTELLIAPADCISERTERFAVHMLLASLCRMLSVPGSRVGLSVDLAMPQEKLTSSMISAVESIRFECKEHRVVMHREPLQSPQLLADELAHKEALNQCEQELERLHTRQSMTGKIVGYLTTCDDLSTMHQEKVAEELRISVRTLHRRLQDEGTHFRALLHRVVISRAKRYLLRVGLSVTETAYWLGYKDSANFTRAFRRTTGMTPSDYVAAFG